MNNIESLRRDCATVGWDGYDAPSVPDSVLDFADKVKCLLPDAWELFPTCRESVQFEITVEDGERRYDEIEIFADRVVYYWRIDHVVGECDKWSKDIECHELTFDGHDTFWTWLEQHVSTMPGRK